METDLSYGETPSLSEAARYAVMGHPVAHSYSPQIHAAFARATGQLLSYERIDPGVENFEAAVENFFAMGGSGLNVTLPFKERALRLAATGGSAAARVAGAANMLWLKDGALCAENTDGIGLIRDLMQNLNLTMGGKTVLLLGAGGAARGVIRSLLDTDPACLWLTNRTHERALKLEQELRAKLGKGNSVLHERLRVCQFNQIPPQPFDLVINATSNALGYEPLPLPAVIFGPDTIAYDLMYGARPTSFMEQAQAAGRVKQVTDGWGMLVEQAAEAFWIWRGVRPATAWVLAALRPTSGQGRDLASLVGANPA